MNKFITLCLLLATPLAMSASDLPSLLKLTPGAKASPKLDLEGISKDYTYTVEKEGDLIRSVSIDFNQAEKASKYIKPDTKGFCMIQKPKSHVVISRYFFFDMATKRRYELTPLKELKSILIQDMPGAVEHSPCTFASFDLGVKKK